MYVSESPFAERFASLGGGLCSGVWQRRGRSLTKAVAVRSARSVWRWERLGSGPGGTSLDGGRNEKEQLSQWADSRVTDSTLVGVSWTA